MESRLRSRGCGDLAVESWLWHPGRGILAVESWSWNPGCGIVVVGTWLWNPGCGILAVEASGSHLGSCWQASGGHLGGSLGIWLEAAGQIAGQRHLEGKSPKKSNTSQLKCKSSFEMSILRCVFDLDIDFDRKFTIT